MKEKESSGENVLWLDGEKKVIIDREKDSFDQRQEILLYRSAGVLGFLDSLLRGPEGYIRSDTHVTAHHGGTGC